jgi:uncharacterized protein (DUF305 family)
MASYEIEHADAAAWEFTTRNKETNMKYAPRAWKQELTIAAIVSLLGVSSLAFAQSNTGAGSNDGASSTSSTGQMQSGDLMKAMQPSDQQMKAMKETGNTDRDYAMMMRAHHQGGIAMSQLELQNGKDPAMRKMAQKIMNSQKKEMAQFDKWLNTRKSAKEDATQ